MFVAAALLAGSGTALAERVFVSQDENASDDNPGTAREPLRTIGEAIFGAQPGDTIVIGPGDYRNDDSGFGPGVVPLFGVQGLHLRAWRNESPPVVGKVLVENSQDVSVRGLKLRGVDFQTAFPGWVDMPKIVRDAPLRPRPDFFDDFATRQELVERAFATYFAVTNGLDFSVGVDVVNSSGVTIVGNDIDGYFAGVQFRSTTGARVVRNRIRHTVNGVFTTGEGPALVDGVVAGNTVSQSLDNGIDIRNDSRNVRVAGNDVTFSGRAHISFINGTQDSSIVRNWVCHGGFYSESMEFPGSSGISVNSCGEGVVVRGNETFGQIDLTGIDGNGIIVDLMEGPSVSVIGNYSAKNAGAGLNITLSPNTVVRRNTFARNGFRTKEPRRGAGVKISRDSDVGNTIVGNHFEKNRAAGILSSFNIDEQASINRNCYLLDDEPLIWDGEDAGQRLFFTIEEVREETGWERGGSVIEH